jgi:hypothetical protein
MNEISGFSRTSSFPPVFFFHYRLARIKRDRERASSPMCPSRCRMEGVSYLGGDNHAISLCNPLLCLGGVLVRGVNRKCTKSETREKKRHMSFVSGSFHTIKSLTFSRTGVSLHPLLCQYDPLSAAKNAHSYCHVSLGDCNLAKPPDSAWTFVPVPMYPYFHIKISSYSFRIKPTRNWSFICSATNSGVSMHERLVIRENQVVHGFSPAEHLRSTQDKNQVWFWSLNIHRFEDTVTPKAWGRDVFFVTSDPELCATW